MRPRTILYRSISVFLLVTLWQAYSADFGAAATHLAHEADEINMSDRERAATGVLPLRVTFTVDPNYGHGDPTAGVWGGFLGSRHQLPTLSSRVHADGSAGTIAAGYEQVRMSYASSICMHWDLRVEVARDSRNLTVEILETVSGWDILPGGVSNVQTIPVHWGTSERAITDFTRIPVTGGWITIRQTEPVEG